MSDGTSENLQIDSGERQGGVTVTVEPCAIVNASAASESPEGTTENGSSSPNMTSSSSSIGKALSSLISSVITDFDSQAESTIRSQDQLSFSIDRLTRELDQLLEDAPSPFIMQHAAKISGVRKRVTSLNSVLKSIQQRVDKIDRLISTGLPSGKTATGSSDSVIQHMERRSWSDLPKDVLNVIRPHVYDQSPYLMAFINNVKCKFYHPVFEDTYYQDFEDIPELKLCKSRISSSNFGWLLMNEGLGFLTFINPFTFELINVPKLDDDKFEIFNFSAPPTSSDCTIVAMKNLNFSGTEIGIIKRGEKVWTISQLEGKFKTSFCNGVFFEGRCYFIGDEFNIGIFDVKTNNWKVWDKRIIPHRKCYFYHPIGMVENNSGMLVVYESHEYQQLYLARFDMLKMTWEKVDCVGDDKVLYVSEGASYLETVVAKGGQ